MPEVTEYQPGTFCWAELSAREPSGAKKFYKEIFAWNFDDNPIPGGGVYTMCKARNRDVCALYEQPGEQISRGVPPHWMLYVSVANVDASTKRATDLGGKVHAPPFDVMDIGRMSVIEDPSGAIFALWQPGKHHGAGIAGELQTVVWNELTTTDLGAAQRFYTGLFGWTARATSVPGIEYTDYFLGERAVAGMLQAPHPSVPTAWTTYFSVADCDATTKSVKALGGKAIAPPKDIPTIGRFAVVQDPQGAVFGIISMQKK